MRWPGCLRLALSADVRSPDDVIAFTGLGTNYTTVSLGKVFHPGCSTDDNASWTEPAWHAPFDKPKSSAWLAVNESEVDVYNTTYLPDGIVGTYASVVHVLRDKTFDSQYSVR